MQIKCNRSAKCSLTLKPPFKSYLTLLVSKFTVYFSVSVHLKMECL